MDCCCDAKKPWEGAGLTPASEQQHTMLFAAICRVMQDFDARCEGPVQGMVIHHMLHAPSHWAPACSRWKAASKGTCSHLTVLSQL